MSTIKKFEEMPVWQEARHLAKIIHAKSRVAPFRNDYALRDQINKSEGSIPDNIAEGFERGGSREFLYFLAIARGSGAELQSQLYRALDRKYITHEEFDELYEKTSRINRMISGFMVYLSDSKIKGTRFK